MESNQFHHLLHSGVGINPYDSSKPGGYHASFYENGNHFSDINLNYISDPYRFNYDSTEATTTFEKESSQLEKFTYFNDSCLPEETKSDWSKSCEELIERPDTSPHIMRKRPRTTFSQSQLLELEKEFIHTAYLDRANRISLAGKLNLKEKRIKVWFQNRRMRRKRDESEQKRRKSLTDNLPDSSNTNVDHNKFHLPFQNSMSRSSNNCSESATGNIPWNLEDGFPSYNFDSSCRRSPLAKNDCLSNSGFNFESFINHYNHLYDFPSTIESQYPYNVDNPPFISYDPSFPSNLPNCNQSSHFHYCSELPYDELQNYHNYYQNNYFD
uniref:XLOX n=1 Tax=Schmidtea polychroa TaxID=50054 RepID=F1CDE7_SCHPL|nr:XLOX [Schmidtea polychroa]